MRSCATIRKEWQLERKLAGDPEGLSEIYNHSGVVSEWRFAGMGYTTTGDAWLAESLAEEERLATLRLGREAGIFGGRGVSIVDQVKKPPPAPDLISIPEAARRVGLHADTLYRLCRAGQFPPAIQIGARWRVSVPRLERYLHGQAEIAQSVHGEGQV